MAFGTLTNQDSRAAQQTTVQAFGENEAYLAIQEQFDAYNAEVQNMLADLVEPTTDVLRVFGPGGDVGTVEDLDQGGSPDAQKVALGYNVGFPLRRIGRALQWDYDWTLRTSMVELDDQITAIMGADRLAVIRAIKRAVYTSSNNSSYVDRLGLRPGITLPIKAAFNNDGLIPPPGPNGETFLGTHTHYLYSTTFTEAAAKTQIDTVIEHRLGGTIRYYINRANETTVRAFTDFLPLFASYVNVSIAANTAQGTLDVQDVNNRMIGYFNGAEVWVKPWVLANYPIALRVGLPAFKPLVFRKLMDGPGFGDLTLAYQNKLFPLYANGWTRNFGIGVWTRDAISVSEMNDGDSAYTIPTIV